ncbi:MAG: hypothetical protein A2857_00545 [Candidatus Levybacteria bacterium RIFCSPHIGHO2_01_FULL_36_15]|nr:MAG: hypothetical protein A2857_00545 [Candidatus Levybacteria bacterium RIFCSPHIGHO2_01_FULL_36_15]OGH38860.1 MAG: hypothetical protein A2905_05475 [Candidatus Levybacteria bacterium RIFCSPLOWO2_01_FULL_36_10]
MLSRETEGNPPPVNLEFLNVHKPSIEIIKKLRTEGSIRAGSPYWWSTDFVPDPREYMPFEQFRSRLVPVEKDGKTYFHLYTQKAVPMTTVTLPIEGEDLTFMVTARPYRLDSKNLVDCGDLTDRFFDRSFSEIAEDIEKYHGTIMQLHCLPHVRGLFVGAGGNHIFWYPDRNISFIEKIEDALKKQNLNFIQPAGYSGAGRVELSYANAHEELTQKKLIAGRTAVKINFPHEEVSADEFLDYQKTEGDLVLCYPLRLPTINETIPLAIATRTHATSHKKAPVVLGVSAGTDRYLEQMRAIWRIKDRNFAERISDAISSDFKFPVDTVFFDPHAKVQYKRVSLRI